MDKNGFIRSFCLRASLQVLAWEIVTVGLTYFLHRQVSWLRHNRFGDLLFAIGVMEVAVASWGMLNRPYEASNSPWGVPASPVQDGGQQKQYQLLAEVMQQKGTALRLVALGLLTILLSLGLLFL
jgi:hypothetical protein